MPEKVADGVWFLAGGSHDNVLVEMADHLILVESPLYDGRTQAVLAATNGNNVNLPENVERLRLDVDRILPLHGRVASVAELRTAVGRS